MSARQPDDILNDALELEPADRPSFIERECAGDPGVRAEVESLLDLHERYPSLLQVPTGAPEALTRERIGSYRVLDQLGRGGMGIVYLAEDPRLKRRIAIKVLPERFAGDPARRVMFEREAQLLAALNHPNIATIHSLEEADGVTFLTMEHVPGVNLAERLSAGAIHLDEALRIARQIARGLEAAHENGVIHRDLKPQNVMVTLKGQVKILDFGLARSQPTGVDPLASPAGAGSELIAGTPGYMSPEQIRGEGADARADIWAFGCLFYECLAGTPVFDGRTGTEITKATLKRRPDWRRLPPETPEPLKQALVRCLERSPGRRQEQIRVVRRVIDSVIAQRRPSRRTTDNVPAALDSFVGRTREREDLRALLGKNRLLTLTGAGGCGKTRLALEVGREARASFPNGVWLVELAHLTDGSLLPQAVARVIGIRERPQRTITESLIEFAVKGPTLMILDNCEQVIAASRDFAREILRAAPTVRILATSRERLRVEGEIAFRVPSLHVPDADGSPPPEALEGIDSVRLFVERARALRPDFALTSQNSSAIGEICRRLDGIPLAIELAAARVGTLPVEEIARRLDDRFRLLTISGTSVLPRHGTLTALFDWSHALLTEREQKVFRRLSTFASGWTLDAGEDVCAGDGVKGWEILDLLSALIDKSLVEVDEAASAKTAQPRYRMIETIRQYAREKLTASGEFAETRRSHRAFFLAFAERAAPNLFGPDQGQWFARLDADHENLRFAQDACTSSETRVALRLAVALGPFWMAQGHWTEGRRIYSDLLSRPSSRRYASLRALGIHWAANLAECQGDLAPALALNEEALKIRRGLRGRKDIARSLNNLGNVNQRMGNLEEARKLYEESLEIQREIGNRLDVAHVLNNLGSISGAQGKLEDASRFFGMSLAIKREIGDQSAIARTLNNLGSLAAMQKEWPSARTYFEEALTLQRGLGDRAGIASVLANQGEMAEVLGDHESALSHLRESLSIRRGTGDLPGCLELIESITAVYSALGQSAIAAQLGEAVERLRPHVSGEGSAPRGAGISLDALADFALGKPAMPT